MNLAVYSSLFEPDISGCPSNITVVGFDVDCVLTLTVFTEMSLMYPSGATISEIVYCLGIMLERRTMPEVLFASSALSSVTAKLLLLVNGFGVIRKVAPPIGLFFSSTFSIISEGDDEVMLLLDDSDEFLFKEYANTFSLFLSSLPIIFAILLLSKLVSSKVWLIKIKVITKPKNIIAEIYIDSKLKCINLAFNNKNIILRKFIVYLLDIFKSL